MLLPSRAHTRAFTRVGAVLSGDTHAARDVVDAPVVDTTDPTPSPTASKAGRWYFDPETTVAAGKAPNGLPLFRGPLYDKISREPVGTAVWAKVSMEAGADGAVDSVLSGKMLAANDLVYEMPKVKKEAVPARATETVSSGETPIWVFGMFAVGLIAVVAMRK
jgi:hypothetical protein